MTQRNQFIDDAGLSASSSLTHLLQGHNNECWLNAESDISDINLSNYNMLFKEVND